MQTTGIFNKYFDDNMKDFMILFRIMKILENYTSETVIWSDGL